LRTARTLPDGRVEFSYTSAAHAIAIFDRAPRGVSVDGANVAAESAGGYGVMLPRGEHVVTIRFD
jgi:hypothetical protein